MRCDNQSGLTVVWRRGVTTKTACLMQAVLVSAAAAVLMQSAVNLFWAGSSIALHVVFFSLSLPIVWWLRSYLTSPDGQGASFTAIELAADGVLGCREGERGTVALRVVAVNRFFGALAIKLAPFSNHCASSTPAHGGSFWLTVWESALGKEKFRKVSLFALHHAQRSI